MTLHALTDLSTLPAPPSGERSLLLAIALVAACAALVLCLNG